LATSKRWSHEVTENSNALDLERNVFNMESPRAIASSLKRSAERSTRRKSDPYRSAMSMLTFYINRAGKNLPQKRREKLEAAKDELRSLFGKKASRA
jgi:phosphoenolpyruvate carboxylase